ncbi:uncharacterized protein RBU57_000276 [Macrochelys suwanniensis]
MQEGSELTDGSLQKQSLNSVSLGNSSDLECSDYDAFVWKIKANKKHMKDKLEQAYTISKLKSDVQQTVKHQLKLVKRKKDYAENLKPRKQDTSYALSSHKTKELFFSTEKLKKAIKSKHPPKTEILPSVASNKPVTISVTAQKQKPVKQESKDAMDDVRTSDKYGEIYVRGEESNEEQRELKKKERFIKQIAVTLSSSSSEESSNDLAKYVLQRRKMHKDRYKDTGTQKEIEAVENVNDLEEKDTETEEEQDTNKQRESAEETNIKSLSEEETKVKRFDDNYPDEAPQRNAKNEKFNQTEKSQESEMGMKEGESEKENQDEKANSEEESGEEEDENEVRKGDDDDDEDDTLIVRDGDEEEKDNGEESEKAESQYEGEGDYERKAKAEENHHRRGTEERSEEGNFKEEETVGKGEEKKDEEMVGEKEGKCKEEQSEDTEVEAESEGGEEDEEEEDEDSEREEEGEEENVGEKIKENKHLQRHNKNRKQEKKESAVQSSKQKVKTKQHVVNGLHNSEQFWNNVLPHYLTLK